MAKRRNMVKALESAFFEPEKKEIQKSVNPYFHKLLVIYEEYERDILTGILTGISVINMLAMVIRYFYCFVYLDRVILSTNAYYLVFSVAAPAVSWALLTTYDWFNFHKRKWAAMQLVILHVLLTVNQIFYTITWDFVMPKIMRIAPDEYMTEDMLINILRIAEIIVAAVVFSVMGSTIYPVIWSTEAKENIINFCITDVLKQDDSAEYALKIIKDIVDGTVIKVSELTRRMHVLIVGASGTGKTSTSIMAGVRDDLDTKFRNREKRMECLVQMLKDKKAYVFGEGKKLKESMIYPKKEYQKEYEKIYKKYPDAGITVMAPNNDLIDNICKMAEKRDFEVNIIDTSRKKKKFNNEKLVGLQPFYIPNDIGEEELETRITDCAEMFTEVLVAVNEMGGNKADVYFTDITRAVTTNIAMVKMLANHIDGVELTRAKDIQNCINNFTLLEEDVKKIEDHYDLLIEVPEIKGARDYKKNADEPKKVYTQAENEKIKRSMDSIYYNTLLFLKQELMGAGQGELFSQARGLRNLINKVFRSTKIMKLYSNEEFVDFDKVYSENQITLINTSMADSEERSKSLGLIILYNLKFAAFRRPAGRRTPHYIYVDELSHYMDKIFATLWILLRQYNVSLLVALQTLAQFDTCNVPGLKDIIMTAGTHIVFGRTSKQEMEYYAALSGQVKKDIVQKTVSRNSILSENPNMSFSERVTEDNAEAVTENEIRMRRFREATILTVENGNVKNARIGKTFFVRKKDFKKRKRHVYPYEQWAPFVRKAPVEESAGIKTSQFNVKDGIKEQAVKNSDFAILHTKTQVWEGSRQEEELKELLKAMDVSLEPDETVAAMETEQGFTEEEKRRRYELDNE